jgi:multicomponent Na+:H+ antiporter subunit D
MPWTMAALVVSGASLVGIPGTAGFISKWLLLTAALGQGALGIIAVVVVVASSLAAAAYVWRIIERAYFGTPAATARQAETEAPWPMLCGLWLVALGNVYFGLMPGLPVDLSEAAAVELLRHLQ